MSDRSVRTPLRRRALGLGLINAALWAAGNALTAGPLISYLVQELGAKGLALSLLLATPSVVGLLRLGTPTVVAWLGSAKRAALGFSLASYLLLAALPPLVLADRYARFRVGGLIALLCVHQLLEFVAASALLAWLADLAPQRIRGRYFARREMAKLALAVPALLASGAAVDNYIAAHRDGKIAAYAAATAIGVALLLASLAPLVAMPATQASNPARGPEHRADWRAPFRDQRFWRFLAFGCWFSTANGLTQLAQNIVPVRWLDISYGWTATFRTGMQVGQFGFAPWAGGWADLRGNRSLLVVCQLLTATSMLWFAAAAPQPDWRRWLVAGAYAAWIFFAGHNIAIPNLALKLAAPSDRSSYVAAWFGVTSVFHAAATVAGGLLWDWLAALNAHAVAASDRPLPSHAAITGLFVTAWLFRTTAISPLIAWGQSGIRPGSRGPIVGNSGEQV